MLNIWCWERQLHRPLHICSSCGCLAGESQVVHSPAMCGWYAMLICIYGCSIECEAVGMRRREVSFCRIGRPHVTTGQYGCCTVAAYPHTAGLYFFPPFWSPLSSSLTPFLPPFLLPPSSGTLYLWPPTSCMETTSSTTIQSTARPA